MSELSNAGIALLASGSLLRSSDQAAWYLVGQLVTAPCNRVWHVIGGQRHSTPGQLIGQVRDEYDSHSKRDVKHWLSTHDQAQARLIFGALMTELGIDYAKVHEYFRASNKYLDAELALVDARAHIMALEQSYEKRVLDLLMPFRRFAGRDLASCYVPVGYLWMSEYREDVLLRRVDVKTTDHRTFALGNLRVSMEPDPSHSSVSPGSWQITADAVAPKLTVAATLASQIHSAETLESALPELCGTICRFLEPVLAEHHRKPVRVTADFAQRLP